MAKVKPRSRRYSKGTVTLGMAQSMVRVHYSVPLEQLLREAAEMYAWGKDTYCRQAARALRAAATSLDNLTGVGRHYDAK